MREVVGRKVRRLIAGFLFLAVILPLSASAVESRINQNGTFEAVGSPLLNPNFTLDEWNKWETVAWGVFLSNFVTPMADTYESAFSAAGYGSNGAGYKALDFSIANDSAAGDILDGFLSFAIDEAIGGTMKPLMASYYYVDVAGNIIVNDPAGKAVSIDAQKDPTKNANIQPEVTSAASFRDILPVCLADADAALKLEMTSGDVGGWFYGVPYGGGSSSGADIYKANVASIGISHQPVDVMGLPPTESNNTAFSAVGNIVSGVAEVAEGVIDAAAGILGKDFELSARPAYASKSILNPDITNDGVNSVAFAKLPVLWVKGADQSWVKVWDMLDPWDYQVAITMLTKEINSDNSIDDGLLTKGMWEIVAENIDAAFARGAPLNMDEFGNIVCVLDGRPYVVMPAAYNKHLTTEPLVNFVNSLILNGPTSGVSGQALKRLGKHSVRADFYWLYPNNNDKDNNDWSVYGPGLAAFGWTGKGLPENTVSVYFDTDALKTSLYKDFQIEGDGDSGNIEALWEGDISYGGANLPSALVSNYGVLDLDLYGNRQFKRGGMSSYVVPKLELAGVSQAGGLGKTLAKRLSTSSPVTTSGVDSLLVLSAYSNTVTSILPPSYNEANVSYVETLTFSDKEVSVFGKPVVVPTAFKAGVQTGKKERWEYLARSFVSYYGTEYYPQHKAVELSRASEISDPSYASLSNTLMYNDAEAVMLGLVSQYQPSSAVASHMLSSEMQGYMKLPSTLTNRGFIWNVNAYINKDLVEDEVAWNDNDVLHNNFAFLASRWVKAYPTNQILTEVSNYLGSRGDSEFSAMAAPWVYLSYLKIYGVDKATTLTLNENPTKFNENIYNADGAPLLSYNIADAAGFKTDEEMSREVTVSVWKLLSPTSGHEYKRQLISSLVGNFIYEEYNRTVFGGTLEYRSGGAQNFITRSQTGFLRFPALEDNLFTRWFYDAYAVVAIWLLAVGLVFVIIFGIFRKRKATWFVVSVVLLVSCVVLIPFVNDMASTAMDGLVSNILKDKTTIWSLTEMLANSRAEDYFLSTGLDSEAAEIATSIARDLSVVYTDRTLMLRQDISHKVVSLGNYSELQSFASTRWVLPVILRQFSTDDGSLNYLYVPLLDVADDAANAYWWYNPKDAKNSGGISASDLEAKYAVGTEEGMSAADYTEDTLSKYYPNFFSGVARYGNPGSIISLPTGAVGYTSYTYDHVAQSYRSITHLTPVHIHDFIYMYMNNTYSTPDIPAPVIPASLGARSVPGEGATSRTYWGDPGKLTDDDSSTGNLGGAGSFLASVEASKVRDALMSVELVSEGRGNDAGTGNAKKYNYSTAHMELVALAQQYKRDERDTMTGEFGYIWSTETMYPYFYALVKDTMSAAGTYDYDTGVVMAGDENAWDTPNKRLGTMIQALSGKVYTSQYFGDARGGFMYQSGVTRDEINAQLGGSTEVISAGNDINGYVFTGYTRDILDLESVFRNVIPYMYQMTLITGGLTGDSVNDLGLFGDSEFTRGSYQTFEGLPESWLYRCNWVTKIVEAPAYNKSEKIGYYDASGAKHTASVTMTYFPDAYENAGGVGAGRSMIFSEAQMRMEGLSESDLTTLELKLIQLNKDIASKWTALLNYINVPGLTAEVLCRQMALDALTSFNSAVTPKGVSSGAYKLYPFAVDLRSLSFDTVMRVILMNATKDSNYFNSDAMEIVILEYDVFTGILLLLTTWICVYAVTIIRAFFLAFLFLMGVYGVARSVLSANNSKKATLFGYLTNIALLFLMSLVYYFTFNILMTGANDAAYVNTGLSGVSAAPGWAIFIVLVVSIFYILGMVKMFRIALGSVIAGTGDLGFGVYKDKAVSHINKISNSIKAVRRGHSFEDMQSGVQESRARIGASVAGVSGFESGSESGSVPKSKKKRRVGSSASGTGTAKRSGAHSVEDGMRSDESRRRAKPVSMEDHTTIDDALARDKVKPPQSSYSDSDSWWGL
jgi:hypothetical protein